MLLISLVMDHWQESDSEQFIKFGNYFIPNRDDQIDIICELIQSVNPKDVIDLGCGEGILSKAILENLPDATVTGYDLSLRMLRKAKFDLLAFGSRFQGKQFELSSHTWRNLKTDAVVSSLAIHHLDDKQKQKLFSDLFDTLKIGGILVIADIIKPTTNAGSKIAARYWSQYVKQKSKKLKNDKA